MLSQGHVTLEKKIPKIFQSFLVRACFADYLKANGQTQQAAIEEQLNEARREGQRLLDQAKEASDRFKEDEMERARQEAAAFVERARADIVRERDAAIIELREGFGDLAITAAERVISRSLDRQAHQDLITEVLEETESNLIQG